MAATYIAQPYRERISSPYISPQLYAPAAPVVTVSSPVPSYVPPATVSSYITPAPASSYVAQAVTRSYVPPVISAPTYTAPTYAAPSALSSSYVEPYGHMALPRSPQPHTWHMSSAYGSAAVDQYGMNDTRLKEVVGLLEIGEAADLPAPNSKKQQQIFITVEPLQHPNVMNKDIVHVGPLHLSRQRASEFFHTDATVISKELRPQRHEQWLSGNVQVIQIRVRVHYCPRDYNPFLGKVDDLELLGVTEVITVSWHADRKVYHLLSPVGSIIGNIYLAHRLCYDSDLKKSRKEHSEEVLEGEVEWGKAKLKVFSESYIMQMSLEDLQAHAKSIYKVINADPSFAQKKRPQLQSKAKPLREPPRHYDDLIRWTLRDVQQDLLQPLLRARPTHLIKIKIISATGVMPANTGKVFGVSTGDGLSDPYVIAEIIDRHKSRFETRVIHGTLNPEWNQAFETECALGKDELRFTLKDKADDVLDTVTMNKDMYLGEVRLPSSQIQRDADTVLDLPIMVKPKEAHGSLKVSIQIVKRLAVSKERANVENYSSQGSQANSRFDSPHMSSRDLSSLRPEVISDSYQASAFANTPMQSDGGPTLKISIIGLRNLSGRAETQAPNAGTCVCQIQGRQNSKREARLGTQSSTFEMPVCAHDEVLEFSIFTNRQEVLGHASLRAVQFLTRGFDAELTLACNRRGITGLLRVKVVVVGAQHLGNQMRPVAGWYSAPAKQAHAQQDFSRRLDNIGPSVIETIDRKGEGLQTFQNIKPASIDKPYDYFVGRSTSMAEGRNQFMSDPRESFAMTNTRNQSFSTVPDLPMRSQSSFFDKRQSSFLDDRQQFGAAESLLEVGPSSSVYEGGSPARSPLQSRQDVYEEDPLSRLVESHDDISHLRSISAQEPIERKGSKGIIDSAKGVFEKVASFVSSGSGRQDKSVEYRSRSKDLEAFSSAGSGIGGGLNATLTVHIISASDLRCADTFGKSDPYCVVQIPGKENSKFQTEYVPQNTDPVWNEKFVVTDYETTDCLEFKVFDWDPWPKTHDFLGKVILNPQEHDFGFDGFDGELVLQEAGDKQGLAKLKIRVETSLLP